MPRAVADSDDEEDDLFAETNNIDHAALKLNTIGGANAELAVDGLNQSNERSTGSTGRYLLIETAELQPTDVL